MKSVENLKRPLKDNLNIEESKLKVKENADKILQQMKLEKEKALEEKKIVQAKIRAIQIQSLKKVGNCKTKPLNSDLEF